MSPWTLKDETTLTAHFIKTVEPQPTLKRYSDGNGLLLAIAPSGSKCWIQRVRVNGKRQDRGLGRFPFVPLSAAREIAFQDMAAIKRGQNPFTAAGPVAAAAHAPIESAAPTFAEVAAEFVALHKHEWSAATLTAWQSTLDQHLLPALGKIRVDEITPDTALRLLHKLRDKPAALKNTRQRLRAIMASAEARQLIDRNPITSGLDKLLPKGSGTKHHAALPYADLPALVPKIREGHALLAARLALEFVILTACRSAEVRGARWSEIDWDNATWEISGERMKSRRPHVVPLSDRAVEILKAVRDLPPADSGFTFPSRNGGPISDTPFRKLMKGTGGTVHGLRSGFRDWAAEQTDFPAELAEHALAHAVGDQTVRSYQRSALVERRRELMQDWADYLKNTPA